MGNADLGTQTLFDAILKDTLIAANINGSWMCGIYILTCFQPFQTLLKDNDVCALIIGFVSTISMMYFCIAVCFLSMVRIGCILNLTFMEEKLGEKLIRKISVSASFLIALGITLILLFNGQILSGISVRMAGNQKSNQIGKFDLHIRSIKICNKKYLSICI